MRLLWSCVLATGLLLVGLEVYEGRRGERNGGSLAAPEVTAVTALEDGTGAPTPPPPTK